MERNIAVVGCGYWGKNLVRNFTELGALHTICDINPKALSQFKILYPNINREKSFESVLADKEIKGVVISTPAALHYPMAKQALLAGKDVFVEKPFTAKSAEAEELVKLGAQQKQVLMVGHLMLYHPGIELLKHYIDSGELGDIHYLYSTRVNLGQVRRDESALWRLTPHDIAMFLYLLDALPEAISAQGANYLQPNLDDVVFATLRFPKGILAHIHASWLDPHKIRQLTVVGSKKMVVFDDMETEHKLKIYDKGVAINYDTVSPLSTFALRSGEAFFPKLDLSEPLFLECRHFIECIKGRQKPRSDGKHGLEVVRILEAIEEVMKK